VENINTGRQFSRALPPAPDIDSVVELIPNDCQVLRFRVEWVCLFISWWAWPWV